MRYFSVLRSDAFIVLHFLELAQVPDQIQKYYLFTAKIGIAQGFFLANGLEGSDVSFRAGSGPWTMGFLPLTQMLFLFLPLGHLQC